MDKKEFIIHFVAVIDNPEINLNRLKERLDLYLKNYKVNVKLHVVTLDELKHEYQYRS